MPLVDINYIDFDKNPGDFRALAPFLQNREGSKGKRIDLTLLNRDQRAIALKYIDDSALKQPDVLIAGHDDVTDWLAYWSDILRFSDLDAFAQQPQRRRNWFGSDPDFAQIAAGRLALNPARVNDTAWKALVDAAQTASKQIGGPPAGFASITLVFGREWKDRESTTNKYSQLVAVAVPTLIHLETGDLAPVAEGPMVNTRHLDSEDRPARTPRIGILREREDDPSRNSPGVDAEVPDDEADTQDGVVKAPKLEWPQFWEMQNRRFMSYQDDNPRPIAEFTWTRKNSGKSTVAAQDHFQFLGIASYTSTSPANRRLLNLIADLAQRSERPALFARTIEGDTGASEASVTWDSGEARAARRRHGGHMGGDFGLDATQRLALWQATVSKLGEITAVSGPPGTGKTSMLQGVIGTLVVTSVIDGHPRVILASSQTNQATTNMIKAFSEIAQPVADEEPVRPEHRWIDGFPSYGWYFPSSTEGKTDKAARYQLLKRESPFAPTLYASGTASAPDASPRRVSNPSKEDLKAASGVFKRRFREYLVQRNVRSNPDPAQWLRSKVLSLASQDAKSSLSVAIATADKVTGCLSKYTLAQMQQASARHKHLSRNPPHDRSGDLRRARVEREHAQKRVERLRRAAGELQPFVPAGFWSHVARVAGSLIPWVRRKRREQEDRLIRALVGVLLEVAPALTVPPGKEGLLGAVASVLPLAVAQAGDCDSECRRMERWQNRLDAVQRARAERKAQLADRVETFKEFLGGLGDLSALFAEHRGAPLAEAFANGLTRTTMVADGRTENAIVQLGRAIWDLVVDAGPDSARTVELRQALECVIDLTVRYEAFHLSMRYWEARWLEEASQPLPENPAAEVRACLERAAMLAPVIVATAQTVPGVATYLNQDMEASHVLQVADWLIVDEAGQVPPQLAVPVTALARNAICVGDVEQLAPVVEIDRRSNADLRRRHGLAEEISTHRRDNLDAVRGNMMASAQYAAARHEDKERERYGVMLRYHYRCRKTIIEFCNRLVYDFIDPLIPMVPDAKKFARLPHEAADDEAILPPMGFVAVEGEQVGRNGSQTNPAEVAEIVAWLDQHRATIIKRYGSVEKAVAVISPYAAQVESLRDALGQLGLRLADQKRGNDSAPADEQEESMIVGTVHALQGAEKEIVLFSAVNGAGSKPFIDSHTSMLNVAVSRAKHAFVVFGHPEVILRPGGSPSGVLGRYLRAHGFRLYPRDLVILESSAKVALVEQAFGKIAEGIATGGHFREITVNDKGAPAWRYRNGFPAFLSRIQRFTELGSQHYDHIFLATDDDTEGEAIAWHVIDATREAGYAIPADRFRRLRFYAMHPSALIEGMALSTRGVDPDRVRAALTRAVADIYIGRRISQASGVRGAGRVAAALLDEIDRLQQQRTDQLVDVVEATAGDRHIQFVRLADNDPLGVPATVSSEADLAHLDGAIGTEVLEVGPLLWEEPAAPATSTAVVLQRAMKEFQMTPKQAMAALNEIYEGSPSDINIENDE